MGLTAGVVLDKRSADAPKALLQLAAATNAWMLVCVVGPHRARRWRAGKPELETSCRPFPCVAQTRVGAARMRGKHNPWPDCAAI